jgi:hypothetical protein
MASAEVQECAEETREWARDLTDPADTHFGIKHYARKYLARKSIDFGYSNTKVHKKSEG